MDSSKSATVEGETGKCGRTAQPRQYRSLTQTAGLLPQSQSQAVWLPREQTVRCNRWGKYERMFSDGKSETRYIRAIIYGKRRAQQYWQLTPEPQTLPKNATWDVMRHIENLKYDQVGNLYGLRNWVEYGLKQSKNELGWADFRLTNYSQISAGRSW